MSSTAAEASTVFQGPQTGSTRHRVCRLTGVTPEKFVKLGDPGTPRRGYPRASGLSQRPRSFPGATGSKDRVARSEHEWLGWGPPVREMFLATFKTVVGRHAGIWPITIDPLVHVCMDKFATSSTTSKNGHFFNPSRNTKAISKEKCL